MDHVEQVESVNIRIHKDFLYLGDPFVHLALVARKAVLLVCPMCSDTFFSDLVHSSRTDLDLDPYTCTAHEGTMKGLISIVLRIVYPVSHTVSLVSVHACDDREYMVALVAFGLRRVFARIEDDSDCIKVIDLLEINAFLVHLVPYRIWSLDPLLDLISEAGLLESLVDRCYEVIDFLVLIYDIAVDLRCDFIECFRLLISEPYVFHL